MHELTHVNFSKEAKLLIPVIDFAQNYGEEIKWEKTNKTLEKLTANADIANYRLTSLMLSQIPHDAQLFSI